MPVLRAVLLFALLPGTHCFSAPMPAPRPLAARASKQAAAHPRCTVADSQAGDAIDDQLRRRLFVDREPEMVPFGLRESYSAAAGALASMALHATPANPSTPWVLLSMALALLCDFGPSARRDMTSSVAASLAAANDYVEAGPAVTLVDNYVNNPGPPDLITRGRQEAASNKLAASARWALLVRGRVTADVVGVTLMLSGRAALGAASLLAAHSAFWYSGAAAARVDACANPSPLSPKLAQLLRGVTLALALAAAVGGLGGNARLRDAGGRAFAVTLVAIQVARLVADRVRARLHAGL